MSVKRRIKPSTEVDRQHVQDFLDLGAGAVRKQSVEIHCEVLRRLLPEDDPID